MYAPLMHVPMRFLPVETTERPPISRSHRRISTPRRKDTRTVDDSARGRRNFFATLCGRVGVFHENNSSLAGVSSEIRFTASECASDPREARGSWPPSPFPRRCSGIWLHVYISQIWCKGSSHGNYTSPNSPGDFRDTYALSAISQVAYFGRIFQPQSIVNWEILIDRRKNQFLWNKIKPQSFTAIFKLIGNTLLINEKNM